MIVPPGDVASVSIIKLIHFQSISTIVQTEADTKTLNIIEARIQAEFKDGLPPHLQPDAQSLRYTPGSTQSGIFVCSSEELKAMDDSRVQGILRDRIILSYGHGFDQHYRWDLPSLGRLYDVDKKTTVHGKISVAFAVLLAKKNLLSCHAYGSC
jgi:hypothetical protein